MYQCRYGHASHEHVTRKLDSLCHWPCVSFRDKREGKFPRTKFMSTSEISFKNMHKRQSYTQFMRYNYRALTSQPTSFTLLLGTKFEDKGCHCIPTEMEVHFECYHAWLVIDQVNMKCIFSLNLKQPIFWPKIVQLYHTRVFANE